LTIAEVAVAYMPLPKTIMVILLVGMAFTKAAMVALYFMHLKFERSTLMWIALTPLMLCVFLSLMLLPDIHP
jgi:cytochrome c oxidase subunit IV